MRQIAIYKNRLVRVGKSDTGFVIVEDVTGKQMLVKVSEITKLDKV